MSIGIGTLQPKSRIMRPVWFAGVLAVVVAVAFAVIVTNAEEEPARDAPATQVSGTAANTPTELRGGLAESAFGGTVANTPSEVRPHVPRRAANTDGFGGTLGNTPTELSGGLPAPANLSYVPIVVNGEVFWRTVP